MSMSSGWGCVLCPLVMDNFTSNVKHALINGIDNPVVYDYIDDNVGATNVLYGVNLHGQATRDESVSELESSAVDDVITERNEAYAMSITTKKNIMKLTNRSLMSVESVMSMTIFNKVDF